jgi:Mg2+ and Co2+ transporter CorA
MSRVVNGIENPIGEMQAFNLTQLDNLSLPAKDIADAELFKKEAARVYGVTEGMTKYVENMYNNLKALKIALINASGTTEEDMVSVDEYISEFLDMKRLLSGNEVIKALNEDQPLDLNLRISAVIYGAYHGSDITQTFKDNLKLVREELDIMIKSAKILEQKLILLENRANSLGCPWSPGRIPELN